MLLINFLGLISDKGKVLRFIGVHMVFKKLAYLVVAFTSTSFAQESAEVLCSKALLSEMKSEHLIGGANAICIQNLNNLPNVAIALGSDVYVTGDANSDGMAIYKPKVDAITNILTGKSLSENSFAINGYADGDDNFKDDFHKDLLIDFGNKASFTKDDIKKHIKDPATKNKILELVADTPDNKEFLIPPSNSTINPDMNKYHPKIISVMSLARNYYLALSRARKTCEKLVGSDEASIKKCLDATSGFASPNSEIASSGQINCGNRRKSVLQLNPGIDGSQNGSPSRIEPKFEIPSNDAIRDMQLASTLNLFKQIKEGGGNADQVIEKIATKCTDEQTTSMGYEYNKQNLKRMYDDISTLLASSDNSALRSAVTAGDYKKAAPIIRDILNSGETDKNYKLSETIIKGFDHDAPLGRVKIFDKNNKPLNCIEKKKYAFNFADSVIPKGFPETYLECKDLNGQIINVKNFFVDKLSFQESDPPLPRHLILSGNKTSFTEGPLAGFRFLDGKYPLASRSPTNTDIFNCLSASAAIEEKMKSTYNGDAGQFIEPDLLRPDVDGQLSASIDVKKISTYKNLKGEHTGWICEKCHNGLRVESIESKDVVNKFSREMGNKEAAKDANELMPKKDMGLTFGSMKNLGLRKIQREHFGSDCPKPKSVCGCLKNVKDGGLDNIIKQAKVVDMKKLNANFDFTQDDRSESCLWAPPVSPSCMVKPNGQNSDNVVKGFEGASCQALKRFFGKYPSKNPSNGETDLAKTEQKLGEYLKKFEKTKISDLQCSQAFPSDDDLKDCPWPEKGGGASTGAGSTGAKVQKH